MQSTTHDYWLIWKQYVLQGVMREDILPPALMQSWRRCSTHGLDPYGEPGAEENLYTTVTSTPQQLLSLVCPAMEDLHQFVEGSECVVAFADTYVRIVDTVGDEALQHELKHLGLSVGASWSEERQGANAIALALHESFPIQLDGAMHYRAALHPLYTSAAPVHDLLGQTVGVLAVIGRQEHAHPHTLGMITAAAQALSNQLQMQVWLSNANDLLFELKTILQTLSEGILLLRHNGIVSQMNAPAGTMLGLTPSKVTGRRLQDVLPLPNVLTQAMVYTIGHISGCHINPAVTFSLAVTRRIGWSEAGVYWLAQFIGGILGALVIAFSFGWAQAAQGPGLGATNFGTVINLYGTTGGWIVAIAMETIGTFFLLLVVMGTAVDGRAPSGWAGLIIGLMVAGEIFAFGPITNVALNPARAFGPAVIQVLLGGTYDLSHLIVYFIGPLLGGVLGVVTYDFLQRARVTASTPELGGIEKSAVEKV